MLTRIHIAKVAFVHGGQPVVVESGAKVAFAAEASIAGPSKIVFDERGMPSTNDGRRRPGIKCWVETDSPVECLA